MPKTRTRKRGHATVSTSSQQVRSIPNSKSIRTTARGKQVQNPRMKAAENLLMPSLVALGCWGLAFSFIFLTSDTNHYLYGGMAVIMAVMWTVMVVMRVNKTRQMQQTRQNVNP